MHDIASAATGNPDFLQDIFSPFKNGDFQRWIAFGNVDRRKKTCCAASANDDVVVCHILSGKSEMMASTPKSLSCLMSEGSFAVHAKTFNPIDCICETDNSSIK